MPVLAPLGEYFSQASAFSLDHFLQQHVIYLKENFGDVPLKRIVSKIIDDTKGRGE